HAEDERELRREPPHAPHALRPDEPVRALLELARKKRRSPEEPDEPRQHHQERDELTQRAEAALEPALEVAAVAVAPRREAVREAGRAEDGVHVPARQEQEQREQRERDGGEARLLA